MNTPNPNEATTRTVIIGSLDDERTTDEVVWVQPTHQDAPLAVPAPCVAEKVNCDGTTVFCLQDATVSGATIRVASIPQYTFDAQGNPALQDIADMWIEFGEAPAPEAPTASPLMTLDFGDASAEPAPPTPPMTLDFGDADDSTPNFGDALNLELADHVLAENETSEEAAEKQAKKKMSAMEKAAKAREERFAESAKVKDNMKSDISKAFADGKRHEDFGPWNFRTKTYDMVARSTDPITGETEYHEVSSDKGDTRVRAIFNPTLATKDSPLGHCLNRAIGPNFVPVEHPDVFLPIIQTVRGINEANGCVYELKEGDKQASLVSGQELITWDAFSFTKGARAMINLDLTGFSTKTRQESAKGLSSFGYVNLSANRISDALVEEQGGHRVGVSIINSHDGKSALQAFMSVLRTYCGNLAARGGVQALLMAGDRTKIRHMEGVVSQFDPEQFASQLGEAMLESHKNMVAMHILRHIPVEANWFDKVMTAFSNHRLVAQPSLTIEAGDIDQIPRDEKGNLIVNAAMMTKDAVKVGHGHAYNAMMQGWMNPDLDYVAMGQNGSELDRESVGTMFHAAQTATGVITHNPIFSDGKRVLHGQKQGIELLMKKSDTAANLLEEIAFGAVDAYAAHTGQPVDDLSAMGEWLADNPEQFKIPYSAKKNGTKVMTPITEIPAFMDTWQYKIKTVKVANK